MYISGNNKSKTLKKMKKQETLDNPTDTILNDTEVVDAKTVTAKKRKVTMKTLKAWLEQTEKIANDEELVVNPDVKKQMLDIADSIKTNFINNKF